MPNRIPSQKAHRATKVKADPFPKTTAAKQELLALAKQTGGKTTGGAIDAVLQKVFGKFDNMSPDQAREASVALNAAKDQFTGFAANAAQKRLEWLWDRSQ